MPSFFSSFSRHQDGPVSMIEGSEPIEAKPLMRARGLRPSASPISLVPISTAGRAVDDARTNCRRGGRG